MIFLLFIPFLLFAYQISDNIIYPKEYKNIASFIKENNISNFYQKSFGYKLDTPIKIGIIKNAYQIPNAFSTQIPFNETIFYNGGDAMSEYFASNSWLITLLAHESAHNYQLNAKQSISKNLHSVLGNNPYPIFISIIPIFTIPNLVLPTFLLEGDSVLNESKFHNGGRLYSGELNALKNSLILNNKITPTILKNNHDKFPYLTEKYIVGGYFMWYLSQKYGYDKVNQFFYHHSSHYINPFMFDTSFKEYFGNSMENEIKEFIKYTKQKYKNFNELNTSIISSKSYINLSKIDNKIYFITTNLINKKLLNIYDKNLTSTLITLNNGQIFKFDKLYTRSNQQISSNKIKWGLFDKNNHYIKNSIGKYYLSKNSYIDINSSFLYPKFYYKNRFFDENISSAFEINNSIFYFKQQNEYKVCYKNKTPIFKFKGYFAKLVDIDKNKIYFIANTKNGSSLFMYDKKIYQITPYDNIINAKKIDNKFLVETINSNGYHITILNPKPFLNTPYFPQIKQNNFKFKYKDINLTSKNYNYLPKFSYLYPSYSYDSKKGDIFTFNILFSDYLMKNMINAYGYFDNDNSDVAIQYLNLNEILPFSIFYSNDEYKSIKLFKNIIKYNHKITPTLNYYKEYKTNLVFDINYNYSQNFLLEFDKYLEFNFDLIAKNDGYGIKSNFTKHLFSEFYTKVEFDYLRNNQIVSTLFDNLKDKSNLYIESFENNFFVDKSIKESIYFSKTFHLSKYFYYFPIAINKENLFITYNHYKLNSTNVNEKIIGLKIDSLILYKYNIPIILKYIYNDFTQNTTFKATFGVEF